jgi:hypothetical protein
MLAYLSETSCEDDLENDDWILHDVNKTMAEVGAGQSLSEMRLHGVLNQSGTRKCAVNETEYSLFNREAYNAFKANPTVNIETIFHLSRGR